MGGRTAASGRSGPFSSLLLWPFGSTGRSMSSAPAPAAAHPLLPVLAELAQKAEPLRQRLLRLEQNISEPSKESAFQFNSDYHKGQARGITLIGEYVRQAIRPTVAFPYSVLILILLAQYAL